MKAPEGEWCRRAYLDILGRVPTPEELKQFSSWPTSSKKTKLLDLLLDSDQYVEEYARNFMTVWTNLLIGRPALREEARCSIALACSSICGGHF